MNSMDPPQPARSHREPGDVADDASTERSSDAAGMPLSRRSMIGFGVPAAIAIIGVGAAPLVLGRDDERLQSGAQPPDGTIAPSSSDSDVFTHAGGTVEPAAILPGSTTTTTTTTTPSTTPSTTNPASTTSSTTTTTSTAKRKVQPIAPPDDPRGYEDQIRLGSLAIPKLGVEAPLFEGIRLTTLDNGPGHWPGTALPGDDGNVVVAAHRTSHSEPFRNIDQLVTGDTVVFTTDAGENSYEVVGTRIVEPDALWIVDPTDDPTATLFACHPPGSVAQRIVVRLRLAT